MTCYVRSAREYFLYKNNFVGLPFKPDADFYMVVAHNVVRMPRLFLRTLPLEGNTWSFVPFIVWVYFELLQLI